MLLPSVPGEAGWYSIPERLQHATGRTSFTGAGQVMQETEYSAPPERLAGSMPFQGLHKPQAEPGEGPAFAAHFAARHRGGPYGLSLFPAGPAAALCASVRCVTHPFWGFAFGPHRLRAQGQAQGRAFSPAPQWPPE